MTSSRLRDGWISIEKSGSGKWKSWQSWDVYMGSSSPPLTRKKRDDGGRGTFQGIGPGNCEMGQRGKISHPRLSLCRYVHLMVPVTNFLFCRDYNVGWLPVFRRGGNSGPTGLASECALPFTDGSPKAFIRRYSSHLALAREPHQSPHLHMTSRWML